MNKNEMYILKQPEKSWLSVVYVDSVFPLPDTEHERLLRLSEISDVVLLFPEVCCTSLEKFGTLYSACGYIEAGRNMIGSFLRVLEYDREILENHTAGVLITQTSGLGDPEKLPRIFASDINKPLFSCRRLSSDEYYEIYHIPEKSWFMKDPEEQDNRYCTHVSESEHMILRPWVVDKLLELKEDYTKIFTYPDLRYFVPSACQRLGIESMEYEVETEGV
jgi:hypothetical protein